MSNDTTPGKQPPRKACSVRDYQEQARAFVERNVLVCQTSLIALLLSRDVAQFTWDDVENVYDDSIEAIEEYLAQHVESDDWHQLPFDEREALALELGFEAEPQEIYEWWVVTPQMARALAERGEPLLRNDYGTWWGRTSTGQAVYVDGIIARVLCGA